MVAATKVGTTAAEAAVEEPLGVVGAAGGDLWIVGIFWSLLKGVPTMRYNPLGKKFRNTTGFWTCVVAVFLALFYSAGVAWRLLSYPHNDGLVYVPIALGLGAAVIALTILFARGLRRLQSIYSASPSPALEESASYMVRVYIIGVLGIAVALQLALMALAPWRLGPGH